MNYVTTLAVILIAAGVFSVLSRWLKQSLAMGYIIAGILVGPYLGVFPGIDSEIVNQWTEIGVIFFFFALGLEFSFKKMLQSGMGALVTAVVKCAGMTAIGYIVGRMIHCSPTESLFLGCIMSMSFPSVIMKSYSEMGLRDRPHVPVLYVALVVENLIAVLMMVLLSTVVTSQNLMGTAMLTALLKPVFFIILCFVTGIWLIPLLLKWSRRYINDEILLIIAIGLCFVMVTMADSMGFSSALGAFIMGSILAETLEGERIEHAVGSIKDLFEAILFVSVGMMVNPSVAGQQWSTILLLSLVVLLGVPVFATLGALLNGQGLVNALHTGFSMAQLGEFAFVIAALGYMLGVMREFIYPVIVSVSVVTIFTTPHMIRLADPVSAWFMKVLPESWKQRLVPREHEVVQVSQAAAGEWRMLVRNVALRMLVFGVLLSGVLFVSRRYLDDWLAQLLPAQSVLTREWVCVGITLAVMLPFAVALSAAGEISRRSVRRLCLDNPSARHIVKMFTLSQTLVSALFLSLSFRPLLQQHQWWIAALWPAATLSLVLLQRFHVSFSLLERSFVDNLNAKENALRAARPITTAMQNQLASYDVKVETLEIPPAFEYIGKTLRQMPFRHTGGANVVELVRGDTCIRVPRGDEVIYPYDRLVLVGTASQIQRVREIVEQATSAATTEEAKPFVVTNITISGKSDWCGKSLRECNFRAFGCLAVAIIHQGVLFTNPKAEDRLHEGDILYLSGEKDSLDYLTTTCLI